MCVCVCVCEIETDRLRSFSFSPGLVLTLSAEIARLQKMTLAPTRLRQPFSNHIELSPGHRLDRKASKRAPHLLAPSLGLLAFGLPG